MPTAPAQNLQLTSYRAAQTSPALWYALLLALLLHQAIWWINIDLPEAPTPEQTELGISLMKVPAVREQAATEQQAVADTPVLPEPEPEPLPAEPEPVPEQPARLTVPEAVAAAVPEVQEETRPQLPDTRTLMRQAVAGNLAADPTAILPQAELAPGEVRRKYISSNTTDWLYASYMNAWTQKVERVGNMNYPEEARRRNLRGDLVMSVGIRQDGTLESIEILRDSGYRVLDEAAIRIVELAAPFSALPEPIAREVDVLYITRTWRFSPDSGSFN